MANHASAKKRLRQNIKRRAHNRAIRSRLRTERKKFMQLVDAGKSEEAEAQLKRLQKLLDQAAAKRLLHPNKAARLLSRATQRLNA